ncbi:MAG: hypothetical protein R6V85_21565 [Polyangia bacterium]
MKPAVRLSSLLTLLALLSAGCAGPRVDLSRGERVFGPGEYQQVRQRWTREMQILPVDGIENVLTVSVTHLSYEMRWAYAVKCAHDLHLSPSERQRLNAEEFGRLDEGHEFYVTAMSGLGDADELEPDEGPWEIRLVDDRGRRVAPLLVEPIDEPSAADVQYFQLDPVHRSAYRILFPLETADGEPILGEATRFYSVEFSSPYGHGEVRWEVVADTVGS